MVAGDLRSACKASAALNRAPPPPPTVRLSGGRQRLDVASLQGPLLEAANAPVREVLSYLGVGDLTSPSAADLDGVDVHNSADRHDVGDPLPVRRPIGLTAPVGELDVSAASNLLR
jgi:hypothetical protein